MNTVNPYQNKDLRQKSSRSGARTSSAGVRAPIGSLVRRSIGLNHKEMYSSLNASENGMMTFDNT